MRLPRLTMDMLAAVVALVQERTMERAGNDLGLTPSAIHKRIQAASRIIGAPLFMSEERGSVLTKSGETLYVGALKVLEMALLAEDRTIALLDLDAGHLRVAHSTYLPPRLLALVHRVKFEDSASIRIEHLPGLTSTSVQRVIEGTAHAGFGYLPVSHPDLLSHLLYEEPVVVCMSRAHPLAVKPAIRPQDLLEEPVIAIGREPLPWIHQQVEEYFAGFGFSLRVVADAFAAPEAVAMTEQSIGICFVGASAVSRSSVVAKALSPKTLSQKSGLFIREDNRHPSLSAFVAMVLEQSRKLQYGGNS